jgi:putative PIG3 family NAD(P)H quinone oxidoreductase
VVGVKAIVISEPGGPEVLQWQDVDDLTPGPGEVLIDVAASAVNRADIMQRQGLYPPPPGASPYPGLECSGRIAALGTDVSEWDTRANGGRAEVDAGFSVGDEVCALLSGGGYAEQVAVPAGQVLPVPAGVDLVEAAGLPEVVCTVWSNVFMAAGLRQGETLLVHGGASGIGTMAIQLARKVGARVAVTAGSAEKLERCRELGAEILVNYRDVDFVEAVREATEGRGADVVLDNMGAKYLARNLDVLAPNGRLVVIGMQGGMKAELDLGLLMRKRGAVISTSLRARPTDEKAAIVASVREHVWPLIAAGEVRPIIDRKIPMAEAAQAHRVVEASDHIGKVLLVR